MNENSRNDKFGESNRYASYLYLQTNEEGMNVNKFENNLITSLFVLTLV